MSEPSDPTRILAKEIRPGFSGACSCGGPAQSAPEALVVMADAGVFKSLSLLDRLLPVWIICAMALGILLGYFVPAVEHAFDGVKIDSVSLPIAIGCVPRHAMLHCPGLRDQVK